MPRRTNHTLLTQFWKRGKINGKDGIDVQYTYQNNAVKPSHYDVKKMKWIHHRASQTATPHHTDNPASKQLATEHTPLATHTSLTKHVIQNTPSPTHTRRPRLTCAAPVRHAHRVPGDTILDIALANPKTVTKDTVRLLRDLGAKSGKMGAEV